MSLEFFSAPYLATVLDRGVETVVQAIVALEFDLVQVGNGAQERIRGQIVAVQFARQIGIVNVVDLRVSGQNMAAL